MRLLLRLLDGVTDTCLPVGPSHSHSPFHPRLPQSLTSLDRLSVTMWSLADEMGLSCALSDLAFCPDTHVRLLLPSSDAAPSPETVTAPHRVLHTCARLEPFRHGCLRVSYHRACVGVAIADDLGPTLRLVPLDGALYAHDVPNAESRETACLSRTAGPGEVQAALDKPWVQVRWGCMDGCLHCRQRG